MRELDKFGERGEQDMYGFRQKRQEHATTQYENGRGYGSTSVPSICSNSGFQPIKKRKTCWLRDIIHVSFRISVHAHDIYKLMAGDVLMSLSFVNLIFNLFAHYKTLLHFHSHFRTDMIVQSFIRVSYRCRFKQVLVARKQKKGRKQKRKQRAKVKDKADEAVGTGADILACSSRV